MNNLITLSRYEFKKLLNRKLVWISFILCAAFLVFSFCTPFLGNYYINGQLVDTNYHMYMADKAYSAALSGRKIDQALLEETISAYRNIPADTPLHYTLTEEYQQYARPYSAIFNFILETTTMQPSELRLSWRPSENDLYTQRQSYLTAVMEEKSLSEGEIRFWQSREEQISKPLVYEEHGGYQMLLTTFQTVGFLLFLFLSISLSGIFSNEHTRKTDQIILCCSLGKTNIYWAKIAAGMSFSLISTFLMFAIACLSAWCLYGTEGCNAAFQLMYSSNSDPITCGEAIRIAYGCMAFAAIAVSVFVMVLSEALRSNVATLAVSAGLLILPMLISVPEQYRVAAQIWDWLPWGFLAPWNVFGCYTVSLFGRYAAPWQAAPVLHLMAGAAIALLGKPLYQRFQISGR